MNKKVLLSNRELFDSMRYLLVPLFVLSVFIKANGAVPNLSVSLSCFKEQVVFADPNQERPVLVPVNEATSLDPVVLKLTISNLSKQDIPVLSPGFAPNTGDATKAILTVISYLGTQAESAGVWKQSINQFSAISARSSKLKLSSQPVAATAKSRKSTLQLSFKSPAKSNAQPLRPSE